MKKFWATIEESRSVSIEENLSKVEERLSVLKTSPSSTFWLTCGMDYIKLFIVDVADCILEKGVIC